MPRIADQAVGIARSINMSPADVRNWDKATLCGALFVQIDMVASGPSRRPSNGGYRIIATVGNQRLGALHA